MNGQGTHPAIARNGGGRKAREGGRFARVIMSLGQHQVGSFSQGMRICRSLKNAYSYRKNSGRWKGSGGGEKELGWISRILWIGKGNILRLAAPQLREDRCDELRGDSRLLGKNEVLLPLAIRQQLPKGGPTSTRKKKKESHRGI